MLPYNRYKCWTCGKYHKNGSKAQERCEQEEVRKKKAISKAKLEAESVIREYKNPYPKDVFVWDNKEQVGFDKGRFNQHCFEIVENMRNTLLKELNRGEG